MTIGTRLSAAVVAAAAIAGLIAMAPSSIAAPSTSPGDQKISQISADSFVTGTTLPSATNTGVPAGRPALVNHDGNLVVDTPGAVIEGFRVKGQVIVNAPDVTVRYNAIEGKANPKFVGEGLIILNAGAKNADIEQNDIGQTTASQTWYMGGIKMLGGTATVHRNNIHDVLDGIYLNGGTITATGNFVHDLMFRSDDTNQKSGTPVLWSHNDGMQIRGGSNHVIDGNYFRTTFSEKTGMPEVANPKGTAHPQWRNAHGIIAQGVVSKIVNMQVNRNWFAYGAVGIQFTSQSTGNSASMSGNRIAPNQSLEYSRYRQFLVDSPGTAWTVTGVGTSTYMNHPDTPAALIGKPLSSLTGHVGPGGWAYNERTATPANGPAYPYS